MDKMTKYFIAVFLGQSIVFAGPIHNAAQDGNLAEVEKLIASGTNVDEGNEYGETALMKAAASGHVNVVTALLDRKNNKANIEAMDKYGQTATILAIFFGQTKALMELLNRGANINVRDTYFNKTGLARSAHRKETVEAIRKWSIDKQIPLDPDGMKILDGNDPGSYTREFTAKGQLLEQKRAAIKSEIEKATKIPAKGPASIIQQYLGDDE